jgi:hypothetical protein
MLFAALCLTLTVGTGGVQPAAPPRERTLPRASVSGRLVTEDGKPLISGTVVLRRGGRTTASADAAGEATVLPDGRFTFREVPPGDYVLRARAKTARSDVPLLASFAVNVRARPVQNIAMTLRPGAVVAGQVVVESRHGTPLMPLAALRVRALLPDGSSGDVGGAGVRPDGRFTLVGLMAGTHVLAFEGLVFPWRVAEARIQGQNAADRAFDVDAGQQVSGSRIVLADIGAGVSGAVGASPGLAMSEVLVAAFPADPLRRALPLRFVRVARPSPDGAYRIVDLEASEYRVIAVVHATEEDAMDPETLERWMSASTPVTLAETQVSVVPLRAVVGDPVP